MKRLVAAFVRRLRDGDVKNALYLAYYFSYLKLYDRRHGTRFAESHPPSETGADEVGGTGNFPAHPRLVERLVRASELPLEAHVLDVGHGSGMVLHVASRMGFRHLTGVEYATVPYERSVSNVGAVATLVRGNALDVDTGEFDAIFFFNPFGGQLAERFMSALDERVRTVVGMNMDPVVVPVLRGAGFENVSEYRHPIYRNFTGAVWRRGGS